MFALSRREAGGLLPLTEAATSEVIRRDDAWNRLELTCHDGTITARINGTTVAQATMIRRIAAAGSGWARVCLTGHH